jgi:quercetin dioxygenase-like cupin family protein
MKTTAFPLSFGSIIAEGLRSSADEERKAEAGGVTVTILARHSLTEAKGKEAIIATVDYAPGAASPPHRHPGSAISYVLEGTIENQFGSEMPLTYERGQVWFEEPLVVHHFARNRSATRSAKTLVFLITDMGNSILLPPA